MFNRPFFTGLPGGTSPPGVRWPGRQPGVVVDLLDVFL
jgi:hypothetical protein